MTGPGQAGADWLAEARRSIRLGDALSRAAAAPVAIATTPKDEVWRDGKVSLARYRGAGPRRTVPLLVLHGLFGRQSIIDLGPKRSLVHGLLEEGADVWVMDWGSPSRADRCLDFTDYAEFWLGDAIAEIRAATGAPRVALLGICQGGVFALCHAARHPETVAGLALAVTPVDFHADAADAEHRPGTGLLNTWIRALGPDLLRAAIRERGNLPGRLTGAVFEQLDPARSVAKYGRDLLALADDPDALDAFLRMETWLADRPDHPGRAAEEWLIDLYCDNALVHGRFAIDGAPVDLAQVACPVLNILARDDHIVPPACSRALATHLPRADYREIEVPTGHVGVFVSRRARDIVPPGLTGWLAALPGPAPTPLSAARARR